MKHLIFDASVILDLWLNRREAKYTESLLLIKRHDVIAWVSAGSLPILEHIAIQEFTKDGVQREEAKSTVKELLTELQENAGILSNYGYQLEQHINKFDGLEEAQIVLSTKLLNGESAIITGKTTFSTLGLVEVKTPRKAVEWLQKKTEEKNVEFIDLKTQQDLIRPQIEQNIHKVLHHGRYIMGPEVGDLEQILADFVGVKHCIGVSSGTDALLISMMALEIGAGDEVITTPFTFIATAEMIALLGAKPVYVDIDPQTYNINPNAIETAITSKTKAIIPVSLYGQCAEFDAINCVAKKHAIPVIEDGAQSLGATYKSRQSCSLSTIGCTSFFPSKPLGGYGDGGACFTNDDNLAKNMRQLRTHGQERRYHHSRLGLNGRLDTLQAAILLAKFDVFLNEIRARAEVGQRYTDLITKHCSVSASITTPYIESYNTSVFAQYTIQVDNRETVLKILNEKNIPTAVHYPVPLNQQPALWTNEFDLSVARKTANSVISLPMHPYLEEDEQKKVVLELTSLL